MRNEAYGGIGLRLLCIAVAWIAPGAGCSKQSLGWCNGKNPSSTSTLMKDSAERNMK